MLGNLLIFFCLIFLTRKKIAYLYTSGFTFHIPADFSITAKCGRVLNRDLLDSVAVKQTLFSSHPSCPQMFFHYYSDYSMPLINTI